MIRISIKMVMIALVGVVVSSAALQAGYGKDKASKKTRTESKKTTKGTSTKHNIISAKSEAELKSIIKKGAPTIVIITTTWCEACKQTDPQFKKVAAELRDEVTFVTVDGDHVRIPGVDGYPTIKAYDKGQPATKYTDKKGKKTNQLPWTSETHELKAEVSKVLK